MHERTVIVATTVQFVAFKQGLLLCTF